MSRMLLVDGDIVAFQAAAAMQHKVGNPAPDSFGFMHAFASLDEATQYADALLARLRERLHADDMRIAISSGINWRHTVMPDYKANREGLERPLALAAVKAHLINKYAAHVEKGLEADDLLGIWATTPDPDLEQDRIVVTKDKDLKGVPGWHCTLGDPEWRVYEVTNADAVRWHYMQALAGDRVDGYGGCPGIGMERATSIIDSPRRLVPRHGVITSGKNKGQPTLKWFAEPTADTWACIVSHYAKAGLSEEHALKTARVAKILWADEYDATTGRVKLWLPKTIPSTEEHLCPLTAAL